MPKIHIPLSVPKNKKGVYVKNFKTATRNTGRFLMLAADQKVEHLNDDFIGRGIPEEVSNPENYFKIAAQSQMGVLATQMGLLAKYGENYKKIPYMIKVNSKTNLIKKEFKDPFANCWIKFEDILKFKKQSGLNIVGVGYTVYIGSWYESEMFRQAASLIYEAHQEGMLAVIWMYPRGKAVKNENDIHLIAGGAGVAVCLGADFVKVNYPYEGSTRKTAEDFREVVTAAGRTGVICVGGEKQETKRFLQNVYFQTHLAGTRGNAVGRNIYQRPLEEAVRMANAIAAIALYNCPVREAYNIFLGKKELKVKK